ncbi:hypothetical protein NOR_01296 [Metarhizium rileyi]|uniref:Uncharacterized protein n=1 Tax=Metarhizium rileyi (strain RCEF 4871) TaxID=1649241 RepID=A0A167IRW7_METRR|nr:hypothetical protein NOR_01296 [Metarhizium rileyi RCEF 4871]
MTVHSGRPVVSGEAGPVGVIQERSRRKRRLSDTGLEFEIMGRPVMSNGVAILVSENDGEGAFDEV